MRVLIVSSTDGVYGADRAAYRLFRALSDGGALEVAMLTQRKAGDDARVLGPQSLAARALGMIRPHLDRAPLALYRRRGDALFSPALWPATTERAIRAFAPDIVNLHWVAGGMLPFESLPRLGRPLVWTFHDCWAFTGGCHYPGHCSGYESRCGACPQLRSSSALDLSRLGIVRRERAYRHLEWRVVTPSRWLADVAATSPLLRGVRLETIANSVDLERFRPLDRRQARAWLGLPTEGRLLLFGAVNPTDDPRKGFQHLDRALSELPCLLPGRLPMVAIFGGERRAPTQMHGCETHHLGRLADEATLALAYNAADALVVPSLEENLPNTIVESLACGTPVVAFAAGGIPEMIDPGRTGLLAPTGDAAALAGALAELCRGALDPDATARNCREAALERYAPERQAERYRALFESMLHSAAPEGRS